MRSASSGWGLSRQCTAFCPLPQVLFGEGDSVTVGQAFCTVEESPEAAAAPSPAETPAPAAPKEEEKPAQAPQQPATLPPPPPPPKVGEGQGWRGEVLAWLRWWQDLCW